MGYPRIQGQAVPIVVDQHLNQSKRARFLGFLQRLKVINVHIATSITPENMLQLQCLLLTENRGPTALPLTFQDRFLLILDQKLKDTSDL